MTLPYFTEDAKMYRDTSDNSWSFHECCEIADILLRKGYKISCVNRVGCDRRYHDAWQVYRKDIPRLIEQLFRQRIVVEVQAEGKGMASINFVYDYSGSQILNAVNKFWKNIPENYIKYPKKE